MKHVFFAILTLCARTLCAQSIYIIGNPINSAKEIESVLQNFYFNKKGLNASRVDVYYSFRDKELFNIQHFLKRTIPNKKNWKYRLDTFINNNSSIFQGDYDRLRISRSIDNVNRATIKAGCSNVYYVNVHNDNSYKPIAWRPVDLNKVSQGLFLKKDVNNSTIVINSVAQEISISRKSTNSVILSGSNIDISGTYDINFGRPKGIQYRIVGVHSDWQDYQDQAAINYLDRNWIFLLRNVSRGGSIEIRLAGNRETYSNSSTVSFQVLSEPKVELVFPPPRGQLANCPNGVIQQYYMKIKSNVDPRSLVMRVRKIYSPDVDLRSPENHVEDVIVRLNQPASGVTVQNGTEPELYCLFPQCAIFFKQFQGDDAPCVECINPYDVWSIEFSVPLGVDRFSSWSKPVEVSLVSFDLSQSKIPCPCN